MRSLHDWTLAVGVQSALVGTEELALSLPFSRRGEAMESAIQVYGTRWCGLTYRLRKYLTDARVPYDYFDIEENDDAQQFVAEMNNSRRRFPLVVIEHRVMLQPTIALVQRVLAEHGIRPFERELER